MVLWESVSPSLISCLGQPGNARLSPVAPLESLPSLCFSSSSSCLFLFISVHKSRSRRPQRLLSINKSREYRKVRWKTLQMESQRGAGQVHVAFLEYLVDLLLGAIGQHRYALYTPHRVLCLHRYFELLAVLSLLPHRSLSISVRKSRSRAPAGYSLFLSL